MSCASAVTISEEVCAEWKDFKQANRDKGKISGEETAENLATVRFKIQADDGCTGNFHIKRVRSLY